MVKFMIARSMLQAKENVREYWDAAPCGVEGIVSSDRQTFFDQIEEERYIKEPCIIPFARFPEGKGKRVLEIGVGAGTDFNNWVRHGANAIGIDLTTTALELTRERLTLAGHTPSIARTDAEQLPFAANTFDIVYSFGVIHHSPDTQAAVREILRVLKPGGQARIMIYHIRSWCAFTLWLVHCLAKGKPWLSPRWAVANYLESPGTKAYTVAEARGLFADFNNVKVTTRLSCGDLLLIRSSQNYRGRMRRIVRRIYPRWLVRLLGDRFGTSCLIEATK